MKGEGGGEKWGKNRKRRDRKKRSVMSEAAEAMIVGNMEAMDDEGRGKREDNEGETWKMDRYAETSQI